MKKRELITEGILDSSANIQISVDYYFSESKSIEECHGTHVFYDCEIDIKHVELIVAGKPIIINNSSNLLRYLSAEQVSEIESNLQIH